MKATSRIRTGLVAMATASMLVLGACGGSGSTEDTAQPPLDTTPTTTIAPQEGSIWEYISSNPSYSVLASLVKDAGLDKTLGGKGEFTLFAPSDTVFNAMSAATLETLRNDKEKLTALLLNHVWDVETMSIDFLEGQITVMSGKALDVTVGDTITIEGFPVIKADIRVSNGVIHEIAGVITG